MLLRLLSVVPGALAFAGTHPLVAVSSSPLDAIARLSPSHPSNARVSVFESTAQRQSAFSASSGSSDDDGLCALDRVLLVSVPGLHNSDLNLLSSTSYVSDLMQSHADSTMAVPYVEPRKSKHGPAPEEKLAKRFINECDAQLSVSTGSHASTRRHGKTLDIVLFDDELEYLPITGQQAKDARRQVMHKLDSLIQSRLSDARTDDAWLFVLTDLPESASRDLRQAVSTMSLRKRQFIEDDDEALSAFEDALSEIDFLQKDKGGKHNSTDSIFAPAPGAGLLAHYVLFSPSILFCVLVTLLIFAPAVYYGSVVLRSATTPHGLEHKMTGSTGVDSSKSS